MPQPARPYRKTIFQHSIWRVHLHSGELYLRWLPMQHCHVWLVGLVQPAVPCTKVLGQRGNWRLKCSPHSTCQATRLEGAASASGKGCFCLICPRCCVDRRGHIPGSLPDTECDHSIPGGVPQMDYRCAKYQSFLHMGLLGRVITSSHKKSCIGVRWFAISR